MNKFSGWSITHKKTVTGNSCAEVDGKFYIFDGYSLQTSCNCIDSCECKKDAIETANMHEVDDLSCRTVS